MYNADRCSCLFMDSGGGWSGTSDANGSIIRFGEPRGFFHNRDGVVTISIGGDTVSMNRDPLTVLEGLVAEGYVAVGYIGYEYSRFADSGFVPDKAKEGDRLPDINFLLFRKEDMITYPPDDSRFKFNAGVTGAGGFPGPVDDTRGALNSNMSRDEYLNMVERAKVYIKQGDVYQVNLSQRFTVGYGLSPIECFLRMFHVQQVPFGCYIDFGDFQLSSGSMELFLRRNGETLTTRPIKGTSERGRTRESDIIKKAKLVSSEKERAENLMIVDLMRNDLSRICKVGSVKVTRLFDVETYNTLHQLVSEVEGRLVNDIGTARIIRNTFPPGSVTGAPKRRVLEVIDELEPHYRGPYCGAVGIFLPGGDFTLSVGIRLLVTDSLKASFWVGGGIVWDSDPEKEYEETILKSLAIKKALGISE